MKTRFNTYDLVCSVTELQSLIGMRVNQVYDIDKKTYLIRLQCTDKKCILLLESGARIHTTAFEWPKNIAPSGFSMKMRKHLKNKRLESLKQIGSDRIIDLQFGSGEVAHHVILELYDRGNIVLTDYEMTILYVLRPHTEGDKIRFAVREKYPLERAHKKTMPTEEELYHSLQTAKCGENLKKILNPQLEFGGPLIDHVLLKAGFTSNAKIGKGFDLSQDMSKLMQALHMAQKLLDDAKNNVSKGYIIQKKEQKPSQNDNEEYIFTNIEFHPCLFEQLKDQPFMEFDTFNLAVDEYFSSMEGQKLHMKVLSQEREAVKKLENVRKGHNEKLISLQRTQIEDKKKAELITKNQVLVDNAILVIQSALANQISWPDIENLVKQAQSKGDPVATAIKELKLDKNHITMVLYDPYADSEDDFEHDIKSDVNNVDNDDFEKISLKPIFVDIDLGLSAFKNARQYYDLKRSAAKKQQKTIESQGKALKSAERKTKQTLKEVQVIHSINKARKVYWFEKFYWFITSENYLVIGGRDQQQNEMIVKRYLKTGDIYVHADLTGASSIIIKNPNGGPVPPKSLSEAGIMAVAYSIAWEAKVVAGAWWVNSDQVSKTAPTGEYLTTGSFMIRGKKNYLPPCQLSMGLGFLFRLEDGSVERHKNERKVRNLEEDTENVDEPETTNKEIEIDDGKDDDGDECTDKEISLCSIKEETCDITDLKYQQNSDDDDNNKDNDNDAYSNKPLFPDTQIKFDLSGPKVKLRVDNVSYEQEASIEEEKNVTFVESCQSKSSKKKGKPDKVKQEDELKKENKNNEINKNKTGLKRGQKSKLKKIKEKYKDQDEEDRRLLMEALQSAGVAKEDKRKNKKKDSNQKQVMKKVEIIKKPPTIENTQNDGKVEEEEEGEEDTAPESEIYMLDQLTGQPVVEDELLFAVPVVAPYNALSNYKFKIKLTPGTGRRGKAAKTAVTFFLKDKAISPREKDLLKSVKDEAIARNIPGKVKLSTPQIQRVKK